MSAQELGQTIKELSEIKFPEGLHGKILRQLVFLKFRTPFLVVVGLLLLNLTFVSWRVWARITENELVTFLEILFDNFEFTLDFAGQLARTLFESAPWPQLGLFAANLFLLGYVALLPRKFQKLVKTA